MEGELVSPVCATHPGARSVGTCSRCGRFLCAECRHLGPSLVCSDCGRRARVEPLPIGGFLYLPMFALFAYPVRFVSTALKILADVERAGFEELVANGWWVVSNVINVIGFGTMAALSLYTLPKFFTRRRTVPSLMQLLFLLNFALVLVIELYNVGIHDLEPIVPVSFRFAANAFVTGLWIAYFRMSTRVRETFVR